MNSRKDVFEGLIPAIDRLLLPDNASQVAHDLMLDTGKIVPVIQPEITEELCDDDVETIFHFRPFGKGVVNDDDDPPNCTPDIPDPYWVKFPFDADFVNSPINGDKYERVYYTGNPDGQLHQLVVGEDPSEAPSDGDATVNPPKSQLTEVPPRDNMLRKSGDKYKNYDYGVYYLYPAVYYTIDPDDVNSPFGYVLPVPFDEAEPHRLEYFEPIQESDYDRTNVDKQDFGNTIISKYKTSASNYFNIDLSGMPPEIVDNPEYSPQFCFIVQLFGPASHYNVPSNSPWYNVDAEYDTSNHHYLSAVERNIVELYDVETDPDVRFGSVLLDGVSFNDLLDSMDFTYDNTTKICHLTFQVNELDPHRDYVELNASLDFSKNGGMNLPAEMDYVYIYQFIDERGTPSAIYGEQPVDNTEEVDNGGLKVENRCMLERLTIGGIKLPDGLHLGDNCTSGVPLKYVRVFRSLGLTKSASFFLVKEIELVENPENDSQWDGEGEFQFIDWEKEIPGFEFDNVVPPPDCMKGLVIHPGRFLAGFKFDTVFLSDVNAPYSWPYSITIDSPVVGLAVNGADIVVLTTGTPTILSGMNPSNMRLTKMAIQQSCVSKKSICKVGQIVVYASPDGIVFISGGQGKLATKGLILPQQWRALHPETSVFVQHDEKVFISFKCEEADKSYCFDPNGQALSLVTLTDDFVVSYNDLFDDALYFVRKMEDDTNKIAIFNPDNGETYLSKWRCKEIDFNVPVCFNRCRVIASEYPVNLQVYVDDTFYKDMIIESERVYLMPQRRRDEVWSYEVLSHYKVIRLEIGQSMLDFMK